MDTNAGMAERMTPAQRAAAEAAAHDRSVWQEIERRGRRAARAGEGRRLELHDMDDPLSMAVDASGNVKRWGIVRIGREELERDWFGEDVRFLKPLKLTEHPAWPFRPRPNTSGIMPVWTQGQWSAVYSGVFCIKCWHRHAEPHPRVCGHCGLPDDQRASALRQLEDVAAMTRVQAKIQSLAAAASSPNRAERRAAARAARGKDRSKGGVILA